MYRNPNSPPGGNLTSWPANAVLVTLCLWLIAACGGGSGNIAVNAPSPAATCDPGDPATAAECGSLLVGITDAEGDFLSYQVDVTSLTLTRADGSSVETLPSRTRMDFAQYVDLTELVTAAAVPPGRYVAGTITLDYSDAEVYVEADGNAKSAVVLDHDGTALGQTTLEIELSDRHQLVIARGLTSLLTVDFDLAASHRVDTAVTPAEAIADAVIIAEIDPVDSKDIRLRGVLVDVDVAAMTYTVDLRPFHRRDGHYGRFPVQVHDDTGFEIDEQLWTGSDGLRALADAGAGTLTLAKGTLNVAAREFAADVVLAGSSVPGSDRDAVKGNVIARSGNELTVRGATVLLNDERAFFRDDVTVLVGPDTRVFKRGHDAVLSADVLSVGQALTVRGSVTGVDSDNLTIDATAGAVRMHLTHVSGIATTVNPGQVDIELHAIDRRRASVFDFSGTGPGPDQDADPERYEIATGSLPLAAATTNRPIVAYGFPTAFGMAPPDFEGRTVVDFSGLRSLLGVGWGSQGSLAPFLSIETSGLLLDNGNVDIDQRHHVKQGPLLIDLTALASDTLIAPAENGRQAFVLKRGNRLRVYGDFADFVAALSAALDGSTAARSMYAYGFYDRDANQFTARKLVVILQPATS